jgi:uncharacterized oligopeptide transporter (OPT) family protein
MFGGELPWGHDRRWVRCVGALIDHGRWTNGSSRAAPNFRVPVLAAAIGIYLPLELMVPIFLGGLIAHFVERFHGLRHGDEDARDRIHRPGTLYAAGLITGEALMGIAIAIPS